MNLKQEVLRDWPQAKFVNQVEWLSCLEHTDTTQFYIDWLEKTKPVLYIIQCNKLFSMGARYGEQKEEYVSPYGNQAKMKALYSHP